MNKLINFVKKETVLSAALFLALASMFFMPPDKEYMNYIDCRTLCILFSLMCVMEGLKSIGIFRLTAVGLLKKAGGVRSLTVILVSLCFFSSMLITNDVALITFVPFTVIIFKMLGNEAEKKLLIPVVVMQTIAANLGSMLTPLGNPQNLYLYGISGMSFGAFTVLLLPFALLSFIMLMIWIILKTARFDFGGYMGLSDDTAPIKKGYFALYIVLFAVCLMTVLKVMHYGISAAAVFILIFIFDRNLLKKVDYSLLLTFAGFFVFIGNMSRIDCINSFLSRIIENNEFAVSVTASQVISNVPAALLLSGFSSNYEMLIIGTNIGGLGTLIASMASLISFKCVSKERPALKKRYFGVFTAANIIFLAAMIMLYIIIY